MKNFYQLIFKVMIVILLAIIPFVSMAQDEIIEKVTRPNGASCYNYWSIGVFGGVMQFNGDLSRNLWTNLGPNSAGYSFGLVVTKQFTRVVGVRARFAYGMIQSLAENKFVWEYEDGNGDPKFISQRFRSTVFETDIQLTINWLSWMLGYKPDRVFSSYLIAGFGMDQSKGTKHDLNMDDEIAYLGKKGNDLNVGNTHGMGGADMRFKISAGIGFDFNINKHFSIPVEFCWRLQDSDVLDMTLGGAKNIVNDMYSSATVGLTYKFAYTCPAVKEKEMVTVPVATVVAEPKVRFSVYSPKNIPVERRGREIFPLRNYIFFNLGSTVISNRYVLLSKEQIKDFKEDQLEMFLPKNLSGRSGRQMVVYYNVINILGDRMGKSPSTTIKLVGSSENGTEDGMAMAESIKKYLVEVFGINASRIDTEGRVKPRIPSEQPGGTKELDLLREGDRRVSIESSFPSLLMEFLSGPEAPLKPVEILAMQNAPIESYVSFDAEGARDAFTSWSLEIMDDNGKFQYFGPYTQERVSLPGKIILGDQLNGDYKVTMIGLAKNGQTMKRDTTINMILWTPPVNQEITRFSIIFEFNESKAIMIYEKYITDIVIPRISQGGTVMIQGYTDIIGDADYNQKLSMARANDVKSIIEKGLTKAGRSDVKFELYAFGEDENVSPFENKFPEERFYNRTVIMDIVPPE
ncbi:MAG: OmpA family protein [Bacteroidales bacterium]|nr:OmpA family protein [Bacteroidales bacterium]